MKEVVKKEDFKHNESALRFIDKASKAARFIEVPEQGLIRALNQMSFEQSSFVNTSSNLYSGRFSFATLLHKSLIRRFIPVFMVVLIVVATTKEFQSKTETENLEALLRESQSLEDRVLSGIFSDDYYQINDVYEQIN